MSREESVYTRGLSRQHSATQVPGHTGSAQVEAETSDYHSLNWFLDSVYSTCFSKGLRVL